MKNCNSFSQSLEEVLRQFHFDLNSIDDVDIIIDASAEPSVLAGLNDSPRKLINTNLKNNLMT